MFGIGRVVLKPGNRPFESGRCTFGRRRRSVELHCWRILSGIWQGAYMLGLVVVGVGNGLFSFSLFYSKSYVGANVLFIV